jgi:hypothetical protein
MHLRMAMSLYLRQGAKAVSAFSLITVTNSGTVGAKTVEESICKVFQRFDVSSILFRMSFQGRKLTGGCPKSQRLSPPVVRGKIAEIPATGEVI